MNMKNKRCLKFGTRLKSRMLCVLGFSLVLFGCTALTHKSKLITFYTNSPQQLFDGHSLAGWRPLDMDHLGDISIQDSAIVMHRGGYFTGITWQGDFPQMGYQLDLDAKRIEGMDFFCGVTFPFGETFASLIIGGWGGYTTGISNINGIDASENGTADVVMFEENVWYHIRLRVTKNHIDAWVDDRHIVDLGTTGKRISLRSDVDAGKPLSIMTYNTTGAVKNVSIKRIETID